MFNRLRLFGLKSIANSLRLAQKYLFVVYICIILIVIHILIKNNNFNIEQHFYSNPSADEEPQNDIYSKYRIYTNTCKISDLPLFDEETVQLYPNRTNNETDWKCEHKKYNEMKIIRINETTVYLDWTELGYQPVCYHRKMSRGSHDNQFYYYSFRGPIKESILHFEQFQDQFFVHIVCYNMIIVELNKNQLQYTPADTNLIHDEIISLIPQINKTTDSDAPNVLLLAIDATSYLNFQRTFIRTEKLMKKYKFFELRGYNKVGANTFPNMVPFLTGHHSIELCPDDKLKTIYFDDWPIIWKDYHMRGFVTAFLEEMSIYGLFNYNLYGFKDKPTDYHLRPFHLMIKKEKYKWFCYANRTETENNLDWTYDFIRAMDKRNQKYFAYISISEFTHDWIEGGIYLDIPYQQFFTRLFDENLLDNTLVLFFSDHGYRWWPLRYTHTGEVESRLPFMFIHLPKNFNRKYTENLRQNQYRLTTPFDIHATLKHLINGKPNNSLKHGQSLFETVMSPNRDCANASIPDMFCACNEYVEIQDFDAIKPNITLPKIVDKINSFTDKVREKCAEYSLHSIHKLYYKKLNKKDKECKLGNSKIFLIQLYLDPGMALFETVIRGYKKNAEFKLAGKLNRINLYGKQPHCLNDKLLNDYCFCKDLLQNNSI